MDSNFELTLGELDEVTGSGIWDKILAAIVAEGVHLIVTGTGGGFPTQVLNGALGAIGRKPV